MNFSTFEINILGQKLYMCAQKDGFHKLGHICILYVVT